MLAVFLFVLSISSFAIAVDHYSAYNSSQCLFNLPFGEGCSKWRVVSLFLLRNQPEIHAKMKNIDSFLNRVTTNCGSDSSYQLFGSDLRTATYIKMSPSGPSKELSTALGIISNQSQTDVLLPLKMKELLEIMRDNPVEERETGALFIFTDSHCDSTEFDEEILGEFLRRGYLIRFLFLTDNRSDYECHQKHLRQCSWSYPLCGLGMYGSTGERLLGEAVAMQTCASNSETQSSLSTLDIVLLATLPVVVITVIAFCCVWGFYRKTVRELIRQAVLNTLSAKQEEVDLEESPAHRDTRLQTLSVEKFLTSYSHEDDPWQIDPANLEILEHELLGRGAFAKVVKGRLKGNIPLLVNNATICLVLDNLKEGICDVAVKRLPPHGDQLAVAEFLKEIDFMKQLGYHAHVISMIGCVISPISPVILLEYCQHGDLLSFLRKNRPHVLMSDDEDCPIDSEICLRICDLLSIAWQIADGMTYLHSKGWIHRDLAARNVLLTKGMVAKISDFGLCRYADSALYVGKGGRLPVKYMSIEALKRFEFSTKSDVWSFGILLHELFSLGDTPYPTIQPMELLIYLEGGHRMDQPQICPNEVYTLMMSCWEEEASERPPFEDIQVKLREMLNIEDEYYGYVALENPKSVRYMLNREISQFPVAEPRIVSAISAIDIYTDDEGTSGEGRSPSTSDLGDYYSTTSRFSTMRLKRPEAVTGASSMNTIQEEGFPSSDTDDMDTWSTVTVAGDMPKLELSPVTSTFKMYKDSSDRLEYCSLNAEMADFYR